LDLPMDKAPPKLPAWMSERPPDTRPVGMNGQPPTTAMGNMSLHSQPHNGVRPGVGTVATSQSQPQSRVATPQSQSSSRPATSGVAQQGKAYQSPDEGPLVGGGGMAAGGGKLRKEKDKKHHLGLFKKH
jgi:hypothetical protein